MYQAIAPALALALSTAVLAPCAASQETAQTAPAPDAAALEPLINDYYAYLDRFEQPAMPMTERLRREAREVRDDRSMTRFTERVLMMLADHHAISMSSLNDSWGVSSKSDMWIESVGSRYVVTSVREDSPAEDAGIRPGQTLVEIGGESIGKAIASFWADLGVESEIDPERNAVAARVLATGRRDRDRTLAIADETGTITRHKLPNLYALALEDRSLLSVKDEGDSTRITINDSLFDNDLIPAFDDAMSAIDPERSIVIDLTDTASGGNTSVARAIMGWFVEDEQPYQVHSLPYEERQLGVVRKWRELVLPRADKQHRGEVSVEVGRWTGSMGEGLAIGMDALGHRVCGTPMAGLLGAVYTLDVPGTNQQINLPVERLEAVDGTPREHFVPQACSET